MLSLSYKTYVVYVEDFSIYKQLYKFDVYIEMFSSVQFSSVAQSCPALCDPMNHSTPGLPLHHQLPGFTQNHVHQVGDAIQPSHPLSSPSPPEQMPPSSQSTDGNHVSLGAFLLDRGVLWDFKGYQTAPCRAVGTGIPTGNVWNHLEGKKNTTKKTGY